MSPIDPSEFYDNPRSSMAPHFVDEDPDADLVEQGLAEAENETREAVAGAYESHALESDDEAESLDDIDYGSTDPTAGSPEMAAMHEEFVPLDGGDDEEE